MGRGRKRGGTIQDEGDNGQFIQSCGEKYLDSNGCKKSQKFLKCSMYICPTDLCFSKRSLCLIVTLVHRS